ncbi:hypothetical protein BdWA1_002687 [Babesia duncani]|uniref:DNA polymerase delta subunit 3 n=1 Tax=Babesia duncani TaxID=323732 RepID=A0AAD9PJP6_9APIC|nr:hypothetical protein BdWA1_002687 [Babesia duncani]
MGANADVVEHLLADFKRATVFSVAHELETTAKEAAKIIESFAQENSRYTLIYSVTFRDKDNNTILSQVTQDKLQELVNNYGYVTCEISGVYDSNVDMAQSSQIAFHHEIKTAKAKLENARSNNCLYIPNHLTIQASDLQVRQGFAGPVVVPTISTPKAVTITKPSQQNFFQQKPVEPPKPVEKPTKTPLTISSPFEVAKKQVHVKKREPQKPIETPQEKRQKWIETIDTNSISLFDMDDPLMFEEEKKDEKPKNVTYLEKRIKEDTYMEGGYFVIEENEEYIQVNRNVEPEKPKMSFTKPTKPKETKQFSITSFFGK